MKKVLILYSIVLAVVILLTACKSGESGAEDVIPQATTIYDENRENEDGISRTIMIYMIGSDLESGSGAASNNIRQMLASGIDLEKNNVLLQTGGTSSWEHDIPGDKSMIFEIGSNDLIAVFEQPVKNMAEPETLTAFLSYCYNNYSTDAYSLILWDHGGGPVYGYGYDEIFEDAMSLEGLCQALENSPFGTDNKLEWVGFDACLMSSIEVAFAFYGYADYLVASQETEPGWGWDYSFLGKITPTGTTEEIAVCIIDAYIDYCYMVFDEFPRALTDATLSCLDLEYIPDVAEGLDILYQQAYDSLDARSFPAAALVRNNTKEFGSMNTCGRPYDLVDLKHLNELISLNYGTQTEVLDKALDDLIVYNKGNVDNANGVSIYYPFNFEAELDSLMKMYISIEFSGGYSDYIQKFSRLQNGPQFESWDLSASKAVQESGLSFSVQLTPEQVRTYAKANYYVLAQMDNGAYYRMFVSWDVTLADDGRLIANYNGKTQRIRNKDNDEIYFCTVIERERTDSYIRYHIPVIATYINADRDPVSDSSTGYLQVQTNKNGTDPKLLSIVPMNEDNFLAPKQLIDLYYYEIAMFPFYGKNPVYRDGKLAPYEQWEATGSTSFYDMYLNRETQDSIDFELTDLDISDKIYILFHVFDVQNNIAASALIPINQTT